MTLGLGLLAFCAVALLWIFELAMHPAAAGA
jgi:hypothetical protein